jgi:hypothetical protein
MNGRTASHENLRMTATRIPPMRAIAAMLAFAVASATMSRARANGPPPEGVVEGVVNVVPAGAVAPPSAPEPVVSVPTKPVEFLPGPHPARTAAYLFGGAAVVGLGVGVVFGVLALNEQSDYNARPTGSSLSSANQDAVLADAGLGAAVIAGVTSVVLFLKNDEPAPPSPDGSSTAVRKSGSSASFSVAPTFGPRAAGAGVVLHF